MAVPETSKQIVEAQKIAKTDPKKAEQVFKDLGIKVTWDQMQYPDYQSKAPSYDMFIAFISIDSNAMANVERQITTSQWYNPKPGVAAFPKVKAQVEKVTEAGKMEAITGPDWHHRQCPWIVAGELEMQASCNDHSSFCPQS